MNGTVTRTVTDAMITKLSLAGPLRLIAGERPGPVVAVPVHDEGLGVGECAARRHRRAPPRCRSTHSPQAQRCPCLANTRCCRRLSCQYRRATAASASAARPARRSRARLRSWCSSWWAWWYVRRRSRCPIGRYRCPRPPRHLAGAGGETVPKPPAGHAGRRRPGPRRTKAWRAPGGGPGDRSWRRSSRR